MVFTFYLPVGCESVHMVGQSTRCSRWRVVVCWSAIDFGAPKIGGADALVVLEVAGIALDGDLAEFQDIAVTCDTQRLTGVLFHQEDGDALFLVDLPDDPEDPLDDDGGKSQ